MKIKLLAAALIVAFMYSCKTKSAVVESTVKTDTPVVALSPELAEGKMLYENNCANCHKLFPATKHTKEEWIPVLDRMAKKAKITDVQKASIYNYITVSL